jgi:hypothetical protein
VAAAGYDDGVHDDVAEAALCEDVGNDGDDGRVGHHAGLDGARANFVAAVRGGTGLVVLHAADNAFPGWAEYERAGAAARSPAHPVCHHFSFAFVGRRDRQGRFLQRQEFYALSPEFCETYCRRVSDRLLRLAQELF